MAKESPQPASQATRTAPSRKPLSCTSCRQRKIRCNRSNPCDQCLKLGVVCVFPSRRVRASRGRPDELEARDAELLRRISHLEAMLANKDDDKSSTPGNNETDQIRSSTLITPLPANGMLGRSHQMAVPVDDHFASFVKQQGSSARHLRPEFWSNLSNEFNGLRQLIEEGHTDNEDDNDENRSSSTGVVDSSASIILQDPDSLVDPALSFPAVPHSEILFRFYFSNFDPLCKILHRPTVDTYFSNIEALVDPLTRKFKFRSLAAVTFAAYFAATNSMSPEECMEHLGEDKSILVGRYRKNAEVALLQADFLNSFEISTLQAFTIYTVAHRSLSRGRSSWTLIGLAKRIARAFGLHQDNNGRAFSAFEAEMRRRLWWQIVALDMRASEDRGDESDSGEANADTQLPCNINDQDFSYDSQHALYDRCGPSETTLSLLGINALSTIRQMHSGALVSDIRDLTLLQKEQLVKQYAERVQSMYLAGADLLDNRVKTLRLISHYWMCKIWLMLYYPLKYRDGSEHIHSRSQGLQTAVQFLNINKFLEQDACSANFAWYFKTFVPWHAVAVILAEICHQPRGTLADCAWEIVESSFQDWNSRVADSKEMMVWSALKKLFGRAGAARRKVENHSIVSQDMQPCDLDSFLRSFEKPNVFNTGQRHSEAENSSIPQPLYYDPSDNIADQRLDFLAAPPIQNQLDSVDLPNGSEMLVDWNDFTFDINESGLDLLPESYII